MLISGLGLILDHTTPVTNSKIYKEIIPFNTLLS